jgi:hypothetical protein
MNMDQEELDDLASKVLDGLVAEYGAVLVAKGIESNVLLNFVHLEARDWSLEIACNGPDEYVLTDRPVEADPDEIQPPTPLGPVSKQEMEQQVGTWLTQQLGS